MHYALLIGYGASAINPYLAIESLEEPRPARPAARGVSFETALKNYKKAVNKGLLKVFSKMGISTLQSYRGAQVFEAIGLTSGSSTNTSPAPPRASRASVSTCWPRKPAMKHEFAFRPVTESETELDAGGNYAYRVRGEYHLVNPYTIYKLQHAVRQQNYADIRSSPPTSTTRAAASARCAG